MGAGRAFRFGLVFLSHDGAELRRWLREPIGRAGEFRGDWVIWWYDQ